LINYHNKGSVYFKEEEYEEAKKCFLKVLEINKNTPLSYSWLGDCERKMGNYDEAIQLYTKAYELSEKEIYQ
jgi:tetratricopeptide (TPR) repeat protein